VTVVDLKLAIVALIATAAAIALVAVLVGHLRWCAAERRRRRRRARRAAISYLRRA